MFLIDGPYVSDYLKHSLQSLQIPVIETKYAAEVLSGYEVNFISQSDAKSLFESDPNKNQFYTNSENALEWIMNQFPSSKLSRDISLIKDKKLFRDVLSKMHPNYYYHGCPYEDLHKLDPLSIPFPVILKPTIGFFSLGVFSITNKDQWMDTLKKLDDITQSYEGVYPPGVLNNSNFIIEAVIPGDEFAVDCYFDEQGKVVILNMMKHLFASGDDVNDRVYMTSSSIMKHNLIPIQDYLNKLGELFKLCRFQAHIELRMLNNSDVNDRNEVEINAIEINPLRFGGWCSTGDLAQYAWGMNIYEALFNRIKPNWGQLILNEPDKIYSLICLNNSTGISGQVIYDFDYNALIETIKEPLELRKTDYRKYPLFGFLMCRVPSDDISELERLLHSDLNEFTHSNSCPDLKKENNKSPIQ